jgi:predicted ATPase with chaperone activity
MGILVASQQIEAKELEKYMIMGELSLDGSLQPSWRDAIAIKQRGGI